ncbi:transglycosylase SLT domain-containing protein [Cerasicoccus frondis]|uniref:transglycosylase SLT domain-containing protein n=1 Tax=Cerasicoccus frondis TaxID=490090 RepID=UPI0028529B02|nr:transglycosylase SLT domain-containing protein [Cerasicoccus frondis]
MPNFRGIQSAELILSIAAVVIFAVFFWLGRPGFSQIKSPEGKYKIWVDIEQAAKAGDLDPNFVYAICVAESTLDPRANSGYARGLMQLSKVAWKEVSTRPYSQAYNPKTNMEVGVAYLNHLKEFLNENNAFSYANLAASYRYGPYALKDADFRVSRLDEPHNLIYQKLFAGVTDPVETPTAPES